MVAVLINYGEKFVSEALEEDRPFFNSIRKSDRPFLNYIVSGCIGINITQNQDTAVPFPYNSSVVGTRHCRVRLLVPALSSPGKPNFSAANCSFEHLQSQDELIQIENLDEFPSSNTYPAQSAIFPKLRSDFLPKYQPISATLV